MFVLLISKWKEHLACQVTVPVCVRERERK